MEPRRRQSIALAVLGAILAGAAFYIYWPRTAATAPSTSNLRAGASKARPTQPITAPDVHLETLNAPRPKPDDVNRNLFQFKPKPAPPAPPPAAVSRPVLPPTPVPSGPPPPPDIPLKFAMVLSQGQEKVAVLLDSLGHQIYAKEGETIEGRYKVWRIGVESIEISYLDGRGRKTIRMSGS
jgi:hypothetical protein